MMNRVSAESAPAAKIMPMKNAQPTAQTPPSLIDEQKLLDTARRLAELYLSGKPQVECAKILGLDHNAIKQILVSSGVRLRSQHETLSLRKGGIRQKALAECARGGKTLREIAREYRVDETTLRGWLFQEGMDTPEQLRKKQAKEKARLAAHEYVNTDKSIMAILYETGATKDAMYEYLLREGMPLRGSGNTKGRNCPAPAPASPTLPELHDQTGEALSAMQKMFSELTNRLSEMEKLLGAEKK